MFHFRMSCSISVESFVVGQEGDCNEHPGHGSHYWCQDDQEWVCELCLIFDSHKGHNALNKSENRSDVFQICCNENLS